MFKAVFENSFDTIIEFLTAMNELGIKPEHECFDTGHVANLDPLLDMGLLERAAADLVRDGRDGRRAAQRAQPRAHGRAGAGRPGGPNNWGVIGISREQWMLVAAALTLGGNVRVGLEDNFYLPDGEMARSNGDLIAKARQMTEDVGRRPATVAEARERCCGAAPREPAACRAGRVSALSGVRVLDLSRLLPGGLLLAAAGRPRRRGAQGRGHRHGRLRPLGAALLRGRRGLGQVGAVPGAEPRQALDPART